ncbi:right-handed parallel beta-helix repeat-containing protein [Pseudomonas sp. BIGb0427]|uniref:right-handed parallel beta-helix repeat-containing protein n=1 Tax=unclassified Pseudomonas TaxID=196821 RepID=UPI0018A725FD|nr:MULTISPECIES: right-handed parallel beta-helix repeat-containing protein [unclassified Pseudomonas]QPG63119.1 right-handed parallel beta-helix repeat-containing protein [Pseudomonas sp. BIGb0427]UVM65564.1 right-handed parallel beta-helix repeat-containing protein [Pseudomonas sp. B21-009]
MRRREFIVGLGVVALAGIATKVIVSGSSNALKTPTGMDWLPFDLLALNADGTVTVSKDAAKIMDKISMLPSADAESLAAGAHDPFQIRIDNGSGASARSFIGASNPNQGPFDLSKLTVIRAPGPEPKALDWAQGGKFYRALIPAGSDPRAVTVSNVLDEYSRPKPLREFADLEQAGEEGWFFDQKERTLYVSKKLATNVDALKDILSIVYRQPGTTTMRVQGGEAYFENILFLGVLPWVLNASGLVSKAVFKNCAFWYSPGSGIANEGGYVVLDGCEIYRSRDHGLVSRKSGDTQPKHIVINTKVRYAGDVDTYGSTRNSQSGLSMNDSGLAVIMGCDIRKSFGPNIVDSGAGAGSQGISWWYGVHCEESLGTHPMNFGAQGVRTVWMEHCSEGNTKGTSVRVAGEGTVLHHANNTVGKFVSDKGGQVLHFSEV